jgi:uncharacterized protein YjbI with pentapeptide repeats
MTELISYPTSITAVVVGVPVKKPGVSQAAAAISEAMPVLESQSWLDIQLDEGNYPCPMILLFDKTRTDSIAAFVTTISHTFSEQGVRTERARIETWIRCFDPKSQPSTGPSDKQSRATLASLQLNSEMSPDFQLLADAQLGPGPEHWNENRSERPNLAGVYLVGLDLRDYNLSKCNLREANLSFCNLAGCSLQGSDLSSVVAVAANLSNANVQYSDLHRTKFVGSTMRKTTFNHSLVQLADLSQCDLSGSRMCGVDLNVSEFVGTNLTDVDLAGAYIRDALFRFSTLRRTFFKTAQLEGCQFLDCDLTAANLELANLVGVRVDNSILDNVEVYGSSVWDLTGEPRSSRSVTISGPDRSRIEVDDIRVAQFIHLISTNSNLRRVIEATSTTAVLILGRFSADGLATINAIREELRRNGLVPIVFDFDGPDTRNVSETIRLLAQLCRFVIADLTEARSVQQELTLIAPVTRVPIAPVIRRGHAIWSMFTDLVQMYHWVLSPVEFDEPTALAEMLQSLILQPIDSKLLEINGTRPN